MSKTWFTADTHFGHANIIHLCNRPFQSVEEMDNALIKNWNETVSPDDTVWHLGDFAWKKNSAYHYLQHLNGRFNMVLGNHDHAPEWLLGPNLAEIKINDQRIVMCHYPMRCWNQSHRGSLMLYGHCHGNMPSIPNSLDVGVDCWNYRPVSLEQIKENLHELHG